MLSCQGVILKCRRTHTCGFVHIKYCEYRVIIDYDERINEGYIECEKTEYGNKSLYRYHIEASIIFDINLSNRTIKYRFPKI